MNKSIVRIATRKSPLALWQAEFVKQQLMTHHDGLNVELVPMVTKGDIILDSPLAKVGGKGLFIKELEIAMQEGRADIAVHSMKDVPMAFPSGFGLHAICEREDPSDAFVSNHYQSIDDLPRNAVVGTSSLRRQCQLKAYRPDVVVTDLRGNVNTRLRKLDEGQYDAIILASAGLLRLDMADRIRTHIDTSLLLPAVGQGAVGIECRNDDPELIELLAPLTHMPTLQRVSAERAMNNALNGGCQVPIAGFAEIHNDQLSLKGLVGSTNGETIMTASESGIVSNATAIGQSVAKQLIAQGADRLLAQLGND